MSHVEVHVHIGGLSFFCQQHSPGTHTQSVLCLCSVYYCAGLCPGVVWGVTLAVSGSQLPFHVVFVKGGAGKCYVTVFVYFSVRVVFVWPCEYLVCLPCVAAARGAQVGLVGQRQRCMFYLCARCIWASGST